MNIYANLLQLATTNTTPRRGFGLGVVNDDDIEVRVGVWQKHGLGGTRAALVTRDNVAIIHMKDSSQFVNLTFAQLGLGAIENGETTRARLVYWYHGVAWPYQPGLEVDLASGVVADATPLADLRVDTVARHRLLKLIRSKAPQAQSYLRVAGATMSNLRFLIGRQQTDFGTTPADFIDAVDNERTAIIAAIPILKSRSGRDKRPSDPLHLCYPAVLDAYIEQNRAALYAAAGIVK